MTYVEIRVPNRFTNPGGLIRLPDISSGILADLDADTLTVADGEPVSVWDASGSMGATLDRAPGASSLPTLETAGPGGAKAVAFGGAHGLATTSQEMFFGPGAAGTAVLVAADRGSAGGAGRFLSGYNPVGDYRNVRQYGGKFAARSDAGTGESVVALPSAMRSGVWGVYTVRWGAGNIKIDSSTGESTEGLAGLGSLNGLVLGSTSAGIQNLTGAIARILIFDRELSDEQVAILTDALATRYAIEVTK